MLGTNDSYPPEQYAAFWTFVWIGCFVLIVLWLCFVFLVTRKRTVKTVASLEAKEPILPDLPALKTKYLTLITEVEQLFAAHTITARVAHQKLSLLLRFFAYEANGTRAHVLTLSDLKQTRLTTLSEAIELYYPPEFEAVEKGSTAAAVAKAREVVSAWV